MCGAGKGVPVVCDVEGIEDFVGENEVVAESPAEVGIAVVGARNGYFAIEESGEVGGPDEFLFAFAPMGEGED